MKRPKKHDYANDPDETRGRALYRAYADKLARAQICFATRRKWLIPSSASETTPPATSTTPETEPRQE